MGAKQFPRSQHAQEQTASANPVSDGKNVNGTVLMTLKMYEWFDEAYDSPQPGLTDEEVKTAVEQGKAAIKSSEIVDPEELTE